MSLGRPPRGGLSAGTALGLQPWRERLKPPGRGGAGGRGAVMRTARCPRSLSNIWMFALKTICSLLCVLTSATGCGSRRRGCRRAGGFDAADLLVAALRRPWPTRHAACADFTRPATGSCAWRSALAMPGRRAPEAGSSRLAGWPPCEKTAGSRRVGGCGVDRARGVAVLTDRALSSNGTAPFGMPLRMFK
jgi:hypothetical protein